MEGIDLGSAKEDLKSKLMLKAVKAALASSELILNILESQVPVEGFELLGILSHKVTSLLFSVMVPPLSNKVLPVPMPTSLQGSHFEPWRNGTIDARLRGEIPKTTVAVETPEEDDDFISEINPETSGDSKPPPRTPDASVENVEVEADGVSRLDPRKSVELTESGC